MSLRSFLFHPLTVLLSSLIGAALFALYGSLKFSGDKLFYHYYYVVPIVVPFVAFLFDRSERFGQFNLVQSAIDALVVLTAMWRVIGNVPFISGHALFLTYALLSARSRVARITAGVVMLQVIYLKYISWHDWITSTGGIVMGTVAALLRWRFRKTDVELASRTATI